MKNIPLLIPNFNQLTYLLNLINWWKFYNPDNPIHIIDNGSNYRPLIDFYMKRQIFSGVEIFRHIDNDCTKNLAIHLKSEFMADYDYYVISDPDIMPHPATPPNFLEIFKQEIDENGYHHVGFQLIIDDLPDWLYKKDWLIGDEKALRQNETFTISGHKAWKAPIDTTFALYTKKNGGWRSPMSAEAWSNSLRVFNAFHLGWYIDGERLNPEMENYFNTAKQFVPGEPSAGKNNYRPEKFIT